MYGASFDCGIDKIGDDQVLKFYLETTEQVKDVTGMLETYSIVDVDLVDKSENPKLFRLSESSAFIEAMNQKLQETIFYGSIKENAAAFDGLTARYAKKSADVKKIGSNIIDAGGKGDDNTSIWFVTWGDLHTSLLYPQGSQAGVQHKDVGILTETSNSGGKRKVYQDHFKMDVGLSVRDWRSTCRIANISVADLAGAGAADLEELLNQKELVLLDDLYYLKDMYEAETNIVKRINILVHKKDNEVKIQQKTER